MSALFPKFAEGLLDDDSAYHVDLNSDDIRVALFSGYTYSSSHDYMNDVTGAATEIARSGALSGVTVTSGSLDHTNETISSVAAGSTVSDIIYYKYNAADSSAILICHIDEDSGGNPLAVATNGGDLVVTPSASGVFTLT